MKTVQFPESSEELRNLLIHEDIVLDISFTNFDYELKGNGFSADRLSTQDIMNFIVNELAELGIVVTWNIR